MKLDYKSKFLLISIFSCFHFSLLSQSVLKQQIRSIVDSTSANNERVSNEITELIRRIDEAKNEANKVASKIQKISGEERRELTRRERDDFIDQLNRINFVYREISSDREYYYNKLSNYRIRFEDQKNQSDNLIQRYRNQRQEELNQKKLLDRKIEKTLEDQDNISAIEIKLQFLKATLETLNNFRVSMSKVEEKYIESQTVISRFLNQMRNAADITKLAVEYLEISGELQDIITNASQIGEIERLTLEVMESLKNLGESVKMLEESTQEF